MNHLHLIIDVGMYVCDLLFYLNNTLHILYITIRQHGRTVQHVRPLMAFYMTKYRYTYIYIYLCMYVYRYFVWYTYSNAL